MEAGCAAKYIRKVTDKSVTRHRIEVGETLLFGRVMRSMKLRMKRRKRNSL